MKTSNIFLIAVLSLTLLVVLGSNLILKAEYDNIDRNDPLYGYKSESVEPFKYVKLNGNTFWLTEIHPGKHFKIDAVPDKKYLDWKVSRDTLFITYHRDLQPDRPYLDDILEKQPYIFITSPEIHGVTSQNSALRIKDWHHKEMSVKMDNGALLLTGNTIENLTVDVRSGGYLKLDSRNQFGRVAAQIQDSSSLKIERNVFRSFDAKVDSTAHINLPGSLYRHIEK
jgi:hypothetical protein